MHTVTQSCGNTTADNTEKTMNLKLIKLTVTASNAIYVDDTRITDRSTKPWNGSATVFETTVLNTQVVDVLIDNGFKRLLSKIDTEPYTTQVTVMERTV